MKNLPLYKGGTCKNRDYTISFNGNLKNLEFTTFEEFCNRADEILYTYMRYKKDINLIGYKKYIYEHKFCDNEALDNAAKDKCFEWILSLEYEHIPKNDLYTMLGLINKEKNKWNMNSKK